MMYLRLIPLCLLSLAGHLSASDTLLQPPPTLPKPVASFGAAACGDRFYVYGGHAGRPHAYNRDDVNGSLYSWAPGETEWTLSAEGEPSQGASLVTDGKVLIRIGGMAARNAKEDRQELWSSNTATVYPVTASGLGAAQSLANLPERRSSHDSVIVGRTLYVFGGWKLSGGNRKAGGDWHETYLTLDLADPGAEWNSYPQPFVKRAIAVASAKGKIYVLGGMDEDGETSAETHVLDLGTNEWSKGPDLPKHKLGGFGFATVAIGERIFASGAEGALLELTGKEWKPVSQLGQPRFFHRFLHRGGSHLLAMGGVTPGHSKAEPEWVAVPAETASAPWPKFQGPRGNGTTPETGWLQGWPEAGEPETAWKAELGVGLSGFAVAGDRVYSAGNDGKDKDTLWCLDLDSGDVIWKRETDALTKIHKMPIVPYGPAATPTVVEGTVYHISRLGHLLALDAATGEERWARHFVDDLKGVLPVYGYASSAAVSGDHLFLDIGQEEAGSNDGSTVCLNRHDGSVVWQQGEGQAGYATPRVTQLGDRDVLVLFKGEALELRDPVNGDLLARHATTTRDFCNCATPLIFDESTLIISHTGKDATRALKWDGSELNQQWSLPGHGLLFHSGTPLDGHVLAFNDESRNDKILQLIDHRTGHVAWQSDELPKGNIVVSDDGLALVLGRNGELVAAQMSKEGVKVLRRMQVLGGRTYVQPVLANGRVLCRNNEGATVCLDLRG